VAIRAVCDTNANALAAARERLGAREQYLDYGEMLERAELDAVIIGTPMPLHAPMAIAALEAGDLHVLSEVTAGVSVPECRALVAAATKQSGVYMMAENYTYMRPNVIVREMASARPLRHAVLCRGRIHPRTEGAERRSPAGGASGRPASTASPTAPTASGPSCSGCRATASRRSAAPAAGIITATRAAEYENEDACVMLCKMARAAW
jgi:predicted dehydrogenase